MWEEHLSANMNVLQWDMFLKQDSEKKKVLRNQEKT